MKNRSTFSTLVLYFTLLFLLLPLIVVVFYSFNSAKTMVFEHLSLKWYRTLFTSSDRLWRAFGNSLIIALASSLTATVLGTAAAIGLKWYRFKGRAYITLISYLPMILPEVIIGISMLIFFSAINLPLGMFTIYAAHTTFNLPFVIMLVSTRLDEFDYSVVEAARDLGARELQTLFLIVLPSIFPGILSAFMIAATMSIEDFVITFFVSGPGTSTLPLYVYSSIRYGVSPVINALSFIMILGTMAIAFTFRKFLKLVAKAS